VALAKHLITWLHDANQATAAEAEFIKATHGGIPDEIPAMPIAAGVHKLPALLTKAGITSSNSEAIRKIKEGAVKLEGEKVTDHQKDYTFDKPAVLQLGSRKFVRLMPG